MRASGAGAVSRMCVGKGDRDTARTAAPVVCRQPTKLAWGIFKEVCRVRACAERGKPQNARRLK